MSSRRRILWPVLLGLVGVLLWTWLVASATAPGHGLVRAIDRLAPPPAVPSGTPGQVAAAVATLSWPGVTVLVLIGLATWASRRRFRHLSTAMVVAAVLGWAAPTAVAGLVARPRPSSPFTDHFTMAGSAYPDTHLTMVTVLAVMVTAATTTSRQPRSVHLAWRTVSTLVVLGVATAGLAMGAHHTSDLVGGLLLGATVAGVSLTVTGVRTVPVWQIMRPLPAVRTSHGLVAVIYNPAKLADEPVFRRHVAEELAGRGWEPPIWLPTAVEDPGRSMAHQALERHVDRVLVAGGDGTVRVVCSAMAHSGVPIGLVPTGTANLLARNLGIPLDEVAALEVAFDGDPYAIDLINVRLDDKPTSEHFAVMAGIGVDALVMSTTREDLKRAVKSVAYFLSVAQHLGHRPVEATVTIDGREVSHRPTSLMVVGNVGEIQAGLQLFPRAAPDDGLLDVILSSPRGAAAWVRWGLERIYRQLTQDVDTHQGRVVRIEVAHPLPYQLDGDAMGEASVFEADVDEQAVTMMLPRRRR